MSHTFVFGSGSPIAVYMEGYDDTIAALQAKHNVLDSVGTIVQFLGAPSTERSFDFWVYGTSNKEFIELEINYGILCYYTDDKSASGSYALTDFKPKRVQALNQLDTVWRCTCKGTHITDLTKYDWQLLPPPR